MGQVLTPSQSTTKTKNHPDQCPHPDAAIKRRANKASTWWTCLDCHQRWQRLPLENALEPCGTE
eukprot:920251-Amphidinium_carterae.1